MFRPGTQKCNSYGFLTELWKSDGTEAGTLLVKDIGVRGSLGPKSLTNVNGTQDCSGDLLRTACRSRLWSVQRVGSAFHECHSVAMVTRGLVRD
ncbi:MAG: hypothetical protein KDB01_18645 [Planctomycetaceae bacterium]|nr:hypothetical protein [Planctomycetaceae bacterium]